MIKSISDVIEEFANSLVGKEVKLSRWRKYRRVVKVRVGNDFEDENCFIGLTFEDGRKELLNMWSNVNIKD